MISPQEEWALKSQTAALVAEVSNCSLVMADAINFPSILVELFSSFSFELKVIRREGVDLWRELLPSLVSLSNKGPIEVLVLFS